MVYARFTPTLTNVTTKAVTQWDYGRKLRIEGLDLPTAVRIDFGVAGDQMTTSRIGITKDRVTDVVIPDSLLEQSGNLVAYVYVNDTEEGKTVRTINIPVTARAMPEEYDTPESKELFAEAIELVNEVAVRAETAASTAESCADTATAAVNAVNNAGTAQVQAIENKGVDSVAAVEAQKQTSIAAVKAEGETQLQAITEETAQIVADRERIDSNYHNKAGAIVLDAEGESIVLSDASEYPLQGLKLFGKSTQDGTPTPDAPVDIVSVENPVVTVDEQTLAIPHILHGIPVTSGGNYTDADGQQWICDEVDLKRGVYVARFDTIILTGEENWNKSDIYENVYEMSRNNIAWKTICSHYPYANTDGTAGDYAVISNYTRNVRIKDVRFVNDLDGFKAWLALQYANGTPVVLLRELTEYVETALSDAEITAFKALHSNKPNTTVLNDAGAHMAVSYVADTKTYIDNKIKELMEGVTE